LTSFCNFIVGRLGESVPLLIFQRLPQLAGNTITNYRTDEKGEWCILIGSAINPQLNKLQGNIQIYNIPKRKSQAVVANIGLYAQVLLDGKVSKSTIFCMVVGNKLLFTEVDNETSPYRN
jgi:hypothetical protein